MAKRSIKAKAIVLVTLPLIVLTVSYVFLFYKSYEDIFEREYELMRENALLAAREIELVLQVNEVIIENLYKLPTTARIIAEMPDSLDWNEYQPVESYHAIKGPLQAFVRDQPIDLLYIASEGSRGIVGDRDAALPDWFDARQRGWYTGAVEEYGNGGDVFITEPYLTADADAEDAYAIGISRAFVVEGRSRGSCA